MTPMTLRCLCLCLCLCLCANKYKHLYNSVTYDVNDINRVRNELEKYIAISCKASHTINVDYVRNVVLRLKPHKAHGIENVSSDAITSGCFELYVHLALLSNAMILYGVSPNNMCCYQRWCQY